MRILIIGGTRFVGHAMAEAALAAGHDVTLLHRTATAELPAASHLLADRNGDLSVLADGRWDATIDVCAYLPGQVASLHDALGDRGGHHVFVSTVSVYADQASAGADEDAELLPESSAETSEVTNETYGPLKVACERVARERWGDDGLTIIRPTYVVGPRDLTGRYPWWVLRAARGGRMILPGPADAPMQCIDARDMGAWTIRLVEDRTAGVFTAARPATTFEEFVADTVAVVGEPVELTPVDGDLPRRAGRRRGPAATVVGGHVGARAGDEHRPRRGGRASPTGRSRRSSATRWRGRRPTRTWPHVTAWDSHPSASRS